MFVIGRNVEVKFEAGRLTIQCDIQDVVPAVSVSRKRWLLATTNGDARLPMSELLINLTVYGGKVGIDE